MSQFRRLFFGFMVLLVPMAIHAGPLPPPPPPPPPPSLDFSDWVQADPLVIYGKQWPNGRNPAFVHWTPIADGRDYIVKATITTITREKKSGDPPVTEVYESDTDVGISFWIGDDGNLHYFSVYKYEDSNGKTIEETYIGTRYVEPGESAEDLFEELKPLSLPTEQSFFQDVTYVPEPNSALLLAAGTGLLLGYRIVAKRRRKTLRSF